ncbi:hypothetical protein CgunFtcFv8_026279 [Champsocephalus gunnari]|uniref:P2X purinoreceptor 7 intracellular domain-containing protein n=1 Tax=Champsocephalus gunnari TaxID=52237 RepID=A0AAN8H455_CHAGU|nr:hypothetical protein CgunFtcFv8_026279 [Champsocephalus gunnari]
MWNGAHVDAAEQTTWKQYRSVDAAESWQRSRHSMATMGGPASHSTLTVCLNEYVLDVAYSYYKQNHGHINKPPHERRRYTAYRQLVRWCWGYLGKQIRVPLPACVVVEIRDTFPSPNYQGFQEPQPEPDEPNLFLEAT